MKLKDTYQERKVICFYSDGNGHLARNFPNKKTNEDDNNQ